MMALAASARKGLAVIAQSQLACQRALSTVPTKLTAEEREEKLATIQGWKMVDGRDAIHKTFIFEDFAAAWDFMSKAAQVAELVCTSASCAVYSAPQLEFRHR